MKPYEGMFILPPEATADARKAQIASLEELIGKHRGGVLQKNEWGKRSLGYLIRKFSEGYVVVVDFEMDPTQTEAFRKALELHEAVLKFMITVKVESKTPPKKVSKVSKTSKGATGTSRAKTQKAAPVST